MSYRLHGAPGSGSGIVEAALTLLGVPFEIRDLDARNDEHLGESYAQLNPQRKMPTLETPEGEVLTEALAICLTLDERHPEGALLPERGSPQRAQVLRWLAYLAGELYPLVEWKDYPHRLVDGDEACRQLNQRVVQTWRARWATVEAHHFGAPYFSDTGLSAIDLYITVLSRWDLPMPWRAEALPKVDALMRAVVAHPKLEAVWARHIPPRLRD